MTYGEVLEKHGYSFCGFWDKLFFHDNNSESGGLIVMDSKGKRKQITWREFKKIAKEVKKNDTTSR